MSHPVDGRREGLDLELRAFLEYRARTPVIAEVLDGMNMGDVERLAASLRADVREGAQRAQPA